MKKQTINPGKKTAEQLKKEEEANALRQQLTIGPDLLIEKKASDKSLDQRIERIELINNEVIDLKQLRQFINGKIEKYTKKFGQEFYSEIFRLNGWAIPVNGKISHKPGVVGKFTIDIIYGRFPKEVLPELQENNKYNEIGMRLYKHFQFLSPEGLLKLEQYIAESVDVMKRCSYWDEFVKEHAKRFGHPFQTSLFA
jgi:hypothetical protein